MAYEFSFEIEYRASRPRLGNAHDPSRGDEATCGNCETTR